MPGIDSHLHFWKYDPIRDDWITDEMKTIRRDFLPGHLAPVLENKNIEGCVVVQSDQSEKENIFQLNNAREYEFIKGVVGWTDLQAENVEERLDFYSSFEKMKGFRHVLQGETRRDLMLEPDFMNGISKLENFNFTYDILVLPDQLNFLTEFVAAFPNQKFVIDHLAKPNIREKKINEWKNDIEVVARYENVYCKISGLVTEADWKGWKQEELDPYMDVVVNAFGINRVMFGSDWPVCLLAADYDRVLGSVKDYFSSYSKDEQSLFFGKNAIEFYNLS